jgi:transcriptional regulator with PAS, ATPase and Fis domain
MAKHSLQQVKQRFGIIGNDPKLDRAIDIALQVAPTDLSVLITGESGTGKENFPQIVHQYSNRKHGPYFAINCGSIPEGTIDSELFGHEKGSFTGATGTRIGYFEAADGGTLFLDEVGELPLPTQARLLRVLESGEFIKVGSSKVEKTNVRVVAATNLDMVKAVERGKFREDLYYRLNSVPIRIPPLRDRIEDIPLLFRKFAGDCAEKYMMPSIALTDDAKERLKNYRWPGNVRQLKNITEQISVIEQERLITSDILQKYLPNNEVGMIPVSVHQIQESEQKSFANEREILYQVLFDMKKDITDLKHVVKSIMEDSAQHTPYNTSSSEMHHSSSIITNDNTRVSVPVKYEAMPKKIALDEPEGNNIQEAAEYEESALSISDVEKEMIMKALERHNGKRKLAANDLGISERTLYRKIKEYSLFFIFLLLLVSVSSCRISYSFRGTSINYDLTKTLQITHFVNQAPLVYPPLEQRFNEEMKDMFTRNTRLQLVNQNGDMEIEGEIVGYELTPMAVQEDAFASETKLTMTVRMRFRNNKTDVPDIEERISANRTFSSSEVFDSVQDQLLNELIDEIVDQIFNATMSNW